MCGVQGEHRVAFGPNNKSSDNASISRAKAPSKNQVDQGQTSAQATKTAAKGGTATQASPGTRQATTPGRDAQQSHQNRPATHHLPPQYVRTHQKHLLYPSKPIHQGAKTDANVQCRATGAGHKQKLQRVLSKTDVTCPEQGHRG